MYSSSSHPFGNAHFVLFNTYVWGFLFFFLIVASFEHFVIVWVLYIFLKIHFYLLCSFSPCLIQFRLFNMDIYLKFCSESLEIALLLLLVI